MTKKGPKIVLFLCDSEGGNDNDDALGASLARFSSGRPYHALSLPSRSTLEQTQHKL
jgi:hypothetical protein